MSMPSTVQDLTPLGERGASRARQHRAEVLILSSSLLTQRMLVHSGVLDAMARNASVTLWTMDQGSSKETIGGGARVEGFPAIRPFREFPYNYLRRLNEFTWDAVHRIPSRESIAEYRRYSALIRRLRAPARVLAAVGLAQPFENRLERWMLGYPRSPEALERLRRRRPAVVVTTGPFQFEQPAIVAAAKQLGIPTMALIPSWDNVSTKNRMVFKYDAYLVWSEWTKRELHEVYPHSRTVPVYVVGAVQFDVFFQERFHLSREAFCLSQGLRPDRPIIVHAIGSPNFIREHHGALDLAQRIVRGDLGDVQLLVRPHPIHDRAEFVGLFAGFGPRVVVQQTADGDAPLSTRSQNADQIREWVNTFRHADVVVNLSSTVAVDAAIFDRPVVNLDFDPEPGQPQQALVKDINHRWTHFKPIAESGGLWLVNDLEELVDAVRTYLAQPGLHREARRRMVNMVCQYADGRCADRMAAAMCDFVERLARPGDAPPAAAGARAAMAP
jgi:hypothetical protein